MALRRVSEGQYKDTKTGKVYNLATAKAVAAMEKKLSSGKANKIGNKTGNKIANKIANESSLTSSTPQQTELGKSVGGQFGEDVSDAGKINTENIAAGNLGLNPNIEGPLGAQFTTINPKTGQATTKHTLSANQDTLLKQGENLSMTGNKIAQGQLENMGQFSFDNSEAGRQKMSDAVFAQLSRGMDTRHKAQSDQLAQDLYNRGIPFSEDPNSRYQQEMRSMQQAQDDERLNYSNQAYQAGLGEQQAQFGMSQATRQQQMSDLSAFQQQGTGLMMPNYQATQGTASDLKGFTELAQNQQQLNNQRKATQASIDALKRKNAGSGGRSSGGTTSPFVS